ncbi:MAG: chorismate synthase [Alistipes sp.]|nr:chorismate synthase [Alistipes sp.]
MNNTFGNILRLTIFGASHAPEVGVIMEGIPAGIRLTPEIFSKDIDRRRPALTGETTRHEDDIPTIEGLDAEGFTTNNPIRISFHNSNTRSKDYSHLVTHPRPSHADLVQRRKYGADYDLAGGGIASGRMTIALVAAGVVAKRIIDSVSFDTRLVEVGGSDNTADFEAIIAEASRAGDSVGGVVECRVSGITPLLGEPFFDSVESVIAHLLFAIPAVKGVEFGDGFAGARKRGSERNDTIIDSEGHTLTNNEGGINGGIANGNDIIVRVAIKPTPSIASSQRTYNLDKESIEPLTIGGRHDACIARRAAVVVEAAVAIALADLYLIAL